RAVHAFPTRRSSDLGSHGFVPVIVELAIEQTFEAAWETVVVLGCYHVKRVGLGRDFAVPGISAILWRAVRRQAKIARVNINNLRSEEHTSELQSREN